MKSTFNSLLMTITGGNNDSMRRSSGTHCSHRRAKHIPLRFEILEQRTLLSGDGVFTRTDGSAIAYGVIEGTILSYPAHSFYDDGNAPDFTFAGDSVSDSGTLYGATASGSLSISAAQPTPVGGTTTFPNVVVNTAVSAAVRASSSFGAQSWPQGLGSTDGIYEIVEESLPDEAKFLAELRIKAHAPLLADVQGEAEVKLGSYQHVSVGPWDILAQYQGAGANVWYVTYNLPEGVDIGFESGTVVSGGLDIHVQFSWDYEDETSIGLQAVTHYLPIEGFSFANALNENPPEEINEASFQLWTASSASVRLVDPSEIPDKIPGGDDPTDPEHSPPKVKRVVLSDGDDLNAHDDYDFSYAGNVGSGAQLKTVPVGLVDKIIIQFTDDVEVDSNDLEIIALNKVLTEPTPVLTQAPNSGNYNTAIWSLTGELTSAQYLLRLKDQILGENSGFALDGEWANPGSTSGALTTSVFPSGDNVQGGDFEFVFTILPGDSNRDNLVNNTDQTKLFDNWGDPLTLWEDANFTGDSHVDGDDLTAFLDGWGKNFSNLLILGDYDFDFDVKSDDETVFDTLYGIPDLDADLDGSGTVTIADDTAFNTLRSFGIALHVVT